MKASSLARKGVDQFTLMWSAYSISPSPSDRRISLGYPGNIGKNEVDLKLLHDMLLATRGCSLYAWYVQIGWRELCEKWANINGSLEPPHFYWGNCRRFHLWIKTRTVEAMKIVGGRLDLESVPPLQDAWYQRHHVVFWRRESFSNPLSLPLHETIIRLCRVKIVKELDTW